jgi:hypothetical protein
MKLLVSYMREENVLRCWRELPPYYGLFLFLLDLFQRLQEGFIRLGTDDGVAIIQNVGRHARHTDLRGFLDQRIYCRCVLACHYFALHFVGVQPNLQGGIAQDIPFADIFAASIELIEHGMMKLETLAFLACVLCGFVRDARVGNARGENHLQPNRVRHLL